MDNRIGHNIRTLRKTYGETQEKLGAAIGVEKNTISMYESGKRIPDKSTLQALAQHFLITVDTLMNSDCPDIGKLQLVDDSNYKWINAIFPIIYSKKAFKNDDFRRGCVNHIGIYIKFDNDLEGLDYIDDTFDCYNSALSDENCKSESIANILALLFFSHYIFVTVPKTMMKRPAVLMLLGIKEAELEELLGDPEYSENSLQQIDGLIDCEGMRSKADKYIKQLKSTNNWNDLVSYYSALKYVLNFVDNDNSWELNGRIGGEMMNSLEEIGNEYAENFWKNYADKFGFGSQIVNDK